MLNIDIEKISFGTASSITDGKATPVPVVARQSWFRRLALRLFPKTRSGAGMSNCFGSHNNSSSQSLENKLVTLKAAQEKALAAPADVIVFQKFDAPGKFPISGHYAIQTKDEAYYLIRKELIHQRSRPLFDKVFGKGSLKDISAFPAAILPDFGNLPLGVFVEWTYDRGTRFIQSIEDSENEHECSPHDQSEFINCFTEILLFADRYSLHEFQDDFLEIFIYLLKMDTSPINIVHIRRFHKQLSQDSKIRVFLVDLVAFIIQEIDASGNLNSKNTALNCALASNKRYTLVELLALLEGDNIRPPHGKFSDPQYAPGCVYHHHGSGEKCPHRISAVSFLEKFIKKEA
ncbi:uncharacterized protein EAE98_012148 [Botrytis deweyae]|uniref:BTB domain-containing protein n=1 Tax=Botrytis deweyae TaxID=2478750 RepID=A0ABQ7I3Y2_9HELO|nr:uncharacterized protein EAE98_012148 [Botrytis deweyae]KAF7910332.1 hypothetical protein EAE98_012148 [Botrytis deweyae]